MLLAKGSNGPITYTDSNGFDKSIMAMSNYYGLTNQILQGELNTLTNENDSTNNSFWGYVAKVRNGWTGIIYIRKSYGFEIGSYDVYIRIRTDTGGASSYTFGIYNATPTVYYPMPGRAVSGLTTSYQIKYVGRFNLSDTNINSNHSISSYFSGDSTYKFVDYVEFRKVN